MAAFATPADVEARRMEPLSEGETALATVLLDDATAVLRTLVDVDETDGAQAANLRIVCVSMVLRAMQATATGVFGVEKLDADMGPFSQGVGFANPNGDLYLTNFEKRLLGITRGRATIISSVPVRAACDA